MSNIMDFIKPAEAKAPRLTVYGKPGVGKSTFAASFPDPLIIPTEETGLVGVPSLPVSKTYEQFKKAIELLLKEEELPFKTIIIDSISKLDQIIVAYILSKEARPDATLATACGGYGKGMSYAHTLHCGIKCLLDEFQDKGISVIYVGHTAITKYKAPDNEDYDIYSIVASSDRCREIYIDDVDAVFLCRLRSVITSTDSGRNVITSTKDREIVPSSNDAYVSKNRFNMPDIMDMDFNKVREYIPYFQQGEVNE